MRAAERAGAILLVGTPGGGQGGIHGPKPDHAQMVQARHLGRKRLERIGVPIVFHVHDEVIVEAPDGSRWQDVADVMGQPIDWAPGLLLRGDGYATKFYLKD